MEESTQKENTIYENVDIDYKHLWTTFKDRLITMECFGNMFEQSIAQAYLDGMNRLEEEEREKVFSQEG